MNNIDVDKKLVDSKTKLCPKSMSSVTLCIMHDGLILKEWLAKKLYLLKNLLTDGFVSFFETVLKKCSITALSHQWM